jgi:hypothetical protein
MVAAKAQPEAMRQIAKVFGGRDKPTTESQALREP